MAPRSPKTENRPDLDESIQIALDAAEASMDVTAEFERISSQFLDTSKKTQQLEKVSRTALIIGCAVAVISVTIMGLIWQRSSSGLERLAATNTELLVIMTENVSTIDQTLAPVIATLRQDFAGLQAEISAISEVISSFEQATAEITNIAETVGLLGTLEEAQARAEYIKTEIGDRVATLNGELALNVSTAVQDTLSGQADAYNKLINEMSVVLNELDTSGNSQDLLRIQASMNGRFQALNEKIGKIQTSTPTVRAPRPQPKKKPDTIKYP